MKLLLDTHILLWIVTDSPMLSSKARELIEDAGNVCLFSPVSIAEISLKHKKHPDLLSFNGAEARSEFIYVGIRELPLTSADAAGADSLELYHNDPFDRILIAQALCNGLTFITKDENIAKYDVPVLAFS